MDTKNNPQLESMIANMPEKTGKSLEEWKALLKKAGLSKHGEMMKLLKGLHGVSHGFANTIVLLYRQETEGGAKDETDLVAAQYAKKAELKPLYDKLIAQVKAFGPDVELAPKKAYVSLRRAKQFAIIQPSTKTRIDLGLNLKDVNVQEPLIEGDKWSGMCSHRIEIHSMEDINPAVIGWLKKAYTQAR